MQTSSLTIVLDNIPMFETDDGQEAVRIANRDGKVLYTWCIEGNVNYLDKGFHLVNRNMYVLLPPGLPDFMDMVDDEPDPEADE